MLRTVKPLPNNKISDQSKLKAIAGDKINLCQKIVFCIGEDVKLWERRKCWLPAFSPFPQCFQNASLPGSFTFGTMW